MNYTSKHIHRQYLSDGGKVEYPLFREICSAFNIAVMDQILKGREFDMGFNLARIAIAKIKRNFNKPTIDWKSSLDYKNELLAEGKTLFSKESPDGVKWHVYFVNEWYCRFYWDKRYCKVKNRTWYRFDATRGKLGNKTKLIALLNADPIAHLNFRLLA